MTCAIIGLGLMKDNDDRDRIVEALLDLLDEQKLNPLVRAAIPVSLGRLGDAGALDAVVAAFGEKNQDRLVHQSCAIALGMLGDMEDPKIIDLLTGNIVQGQNRQSRYFSYIALARIGARDPDPEKHADAHMKLKTFLLTRIAKQSRGNELPWAVLAGAVYARARESSKAEMVQKISRAFEKTRNPSHKGAMSVALGLLDATEKARMIFEEMIRARDKALKGYLCIGLGLMDYQPAADRIRKIVENEVVSYRLKLQAVISLGLLGDREVMEVLIASLATGETLSVTSSAAKALGLMNDAAAITPLKELLEDSSANALARAFAAVALGILGEKTDLPWNSVITEDINYRAKTKAIAEIIDIL
jgi:HEAT repeat protein